MPSYLNQNGNSIGSLLRFIQEQKSQSPINPQSSEVGSPIRDIVQEPLKGSEGQGTSKVVSLRPEGTLTPSGQPIEQGTPQSSRIGPISIGGQGDVTQTPTNVVAANEPGPGLGIPSATKTVGDVMNKTAGASATGPGLGTSIKSKTPTTLSGTPVAESVRGQEVTNYNLSRDKANADKTVEDIKLGVAAGERSTPETVAKLDELYGRFQKGQEELSAQDQELLNRPLSDRALSEARAQRDRFVAERLAVPTPTPTPMQSQGGSSNSGGGGGSSSGGGGGQVKGISTSIKPAISYVSPTRSTQSFSSGQTGASSTKNAGGGGGGGSWSAPKASAPSKPSIATTIGGAALQAFKKLFGR